MHWALALDSAATDLSKTALKTPAGSPLKITSTLQTCLSLISLTHTLKWCGERGGRAVVLCGEQKGWWGRRKGVGFPLPWQQLQTRTIQSSYERLCTAVTRTLTRQLRKTFQRNISPTHLHKFSFFHPAEKCVKLHWKAFKSEQISHDLRITDHTTITTVMLNEVPKILSSV